MLNLPSWKSELLCSALKLDLPVTMLYPTFSWEALASWKAWMFSSSPFTVHSGCFIWSLGHITVKDGCYGSEGYMLSGSRPLGKKKKIDLGCLYLRARRSFPSKPLQRHFGQNWVTWPLSHSLVREMEMSLVFWRPWDFQGISLLRDLLTYFIFLKPLTLRRLHSWTIGGSSCDGYLIITEKDSKIDSKNW